MELVKYFAFGANLNTHVFYDLRKMKPYSWERAVLPDYELRFTEPGVMPYLEPAFASVEEAPGCEVHGVLYYITPKDFKRLNLSESENYAKLDLEVLAESSGLVTAKVYKSRYTKPCLLPSRRYRDLIATGAREFELPEHYCQMLENHNASYVPGLSEAFWKVTKPYLKLREKGLRHEVLLEPYRRFKTRK